MHAERYRVPPETLAACSAAAARRRHRHDDRARARGRRPRPGRWTGRTELLHRPGDRVRTRRRAAHQLPPAPLDAAPARRGVHRPTVARALRDARWSGLPLPLLRRRDAHRARRVRLGFTVRCTPTARRGPATMTTPRGAVRTPCFMPVGTRGAVRTYLRRPRGARRRDHARQHVPPDAQAGRRPVVERHRRHPRLRRWHGHVLTDSGGYQVFSLGPKARSTTTA